MEQSMQRLNAAQRIQLWVERITECRSSGKSVRTWCREHEISEKELIEIGAIDMENDGLAEIAELTQFYLKIELQLNDWYDDGKITLAQRNSFHKDAVLLWKRIHQSCHRTTRNDVSQDDINALSCYCDVMREKLSIVSTGIGLQLSNGEFIKLANEEQIGWRYKWKGRDA